MISSYATVGKLGVAMTIAYASSYCLPAIPAVGMARRPAAQGNAAVHDAAPHPATAWLLVFASGVT